MGILLWSVMFRSGFAQPHSVPDFDSFPQAIEKYNSPKTRAWSSLNHDSRKQVLDLIYGEDKITKQLLAPYFSDQKGTSAYHQAYHSLCQLGNKNFSIKDANFTVEDAYHENKINYPHFNEVITQLGSLIKKKMVELDYDTTSNLAKNLILFRLFADTLVLGPKNFQHLPFKYDFDDFMGLSDWTNTFVLKLMHTNKGQCQSLPLLYLILAEEIGAKAHLALSPNHSYIKFQDDEGTWVNLELTNNMITTDAFILQSGYIKSEAIQQQIYLQPLSKDQLLSQLLVNLAEGYVVKYGYDSFVGNVVGKAIDLYPKNINAHLLRSNYFTVRFQYIAERLDLENQKFPNWHEFPYATKFYGLLHDQYKTIDKLGYEEMPMDAYKKWLESMEEVKKQQKKHEPKLMATPIESKR